MKYNSILEQLSRVRKRPRSHWLSASGCPPYADDSVSEIRDGWFYVSDCKVLYDTPTVAKMATLWHKLRLGVRNNHLQPQTCSTLRMQRGWYWSWPLGDRVGVVEQNLGVLNLPGRLYQLRMSEKKWKSLFLRKERDRNGLQEQLDISENQTMKTE